MVVYHIAVVEDEKTYSDTLKEYLERFAREGGYTFRYSFFSDGDEIAEDYKGGFDIILMDIEMQFMDGMTAAERIRERDKKVIIMFITNMASYAIRGYQVDALDYVLKPVSYFAFSKKMERAVSEIPVSDQHFLTIKTADGVLRVSVDEIRYVESFRHDLSFHLGDMIAVSRMRMQDVEEELVPFGFFRSNRGLLVNLSYVDGVRESGCMIGNEELPISRGRRSEFMSALTERIGV